MPGYFKSLGYTDDEIKQMFMFICVPARLLLAWMIYTFGASLSDQWRYVAAGAIAAAGMYSMHKYNQDADDVPWNRNYHGMLSLLAGVAFFAGKFTASALLVLASLALSVTSRITSLA